MNIERVEKLICLILASGANEEEKTKRIQMILHAYETWLTFQYS